MDGTSAQKWYGTVHVLRRHIFKHSGPLFHPLANHVLCTENKQEMPFSVLKLSKKSNFLTPLPPTSAYVMYEWSL